MANWKLGWMAMTLALLMACGATSNPPTSRSASSTTAASSPASAAKPSQPPAGFVCGGASGGSQLNRSQVVDVRVGTHDGYDRFVVQFDGPVPAYTVQPQAGSTFTRSPSGMSETLAGNHGLLVTMQPIGNWTGYSAPKSFQPAYPFLQEASLIQNFEAVQQWGLGVQGQACLRVTTLAAPYRLVIDIGSR